MKVKYESINYFSSLLRVTKIVKIDQSLTRMYNIRENTPTLIGKETCHWNRKNNPKYSNLIQQGPAKFSVQTDYYLPLINEFCFSLYYSPLKQKTKNKKLYLWVFWKSIQYDYGKKKFGYLWYLELSVIFRHICYAFYSILFLM